MIYRDERPRESYVIPLFAIAAAMTAMAASLAVAQRPARQTRVWVPGVVQTVASGHKNSGRGSCDRGAFQGKDNMFTTFDHRAAKKPLDGMEITMLRIVLRDFCATHGFALDDKRSLEAARRLIQLFQSGESDCARLRVLLDMQLPPS
ncbi:hypothetical protein HA464_03035 [Rhizobium leguminosarum bv. trifolii]|uniref:hypothetical protein n=1 Tax=Rhizobium TaxID=379 RepID=UPI0010323E0D|nr:MULTISPECIES: hypothetical protein [Rhizobium]QIO43057.1 hypothetical protein HA464_03035 [Rhizobium leguminosarum bv. trifolii]TAZ19546.1 hypothetical protein ELH77_12610 [Rhizobium ruizarguesonis]TBC81304.1 hypothetical protein ELH26_37255 [Rhizobium leguminosarum]WSH53318.1 hypothetical protein U8Q06_12320 [Rhizobium beringeri]